MTRRQLPVDEAARCQRALRAAQVIRNALERNGDFSLASGGSDSDRFCFIASVLASFSGAEKLTVMFSGQAVDWQMSANEKNAKSAGFCTLEHVRQTCSGSIPNCSRIKLGPYAESSIPGSAGFVGPL
jgi:hypothetical protein